MKHRGGEKLLPSEIHTIFTQIKTAFLGIYGLLIKVRVFGKEFWWGLCRNSIVVANHVTGSDSFVIQIALKRRLFMMAARRWFKNRFLDFVMTFFCDMVPVAVEKGIKNLRGIKRALALLEQKQSVGIYPSGDMSRDGMVHLIYDGAAYLSFKSGVPIVPVYVKNLALGPCRTELALGDDAKEGVGSLLHNIFNRKIEVHIAAPIYPRIDADRREEVHRINSRIQRSFEDLCE
ncbi:1-acyl-sn-glycerol-3-phosphate acyltransferase [candidate division WOR-3 bacterium]|nr:1-acyl-sn-glycerol-3-phosphate acyltransferase [candidate division WOR-3 bacterium]